MNIKDLRPVSDFANQMGVKAVIYGPPGSGKTPILNTAPRPLLLACEPGLLSMRGSRIPTYLGYTVKDINDFFDWFFKSAEVKNFDTLGVDSTSQMADVYLQEALRTNKHGLKAYGEMATNTMAHLRGLYYTKEKHAYLIAKESSVDTFRKPWWPGKDLNINVPHLYDEILNLNIHNVPGMGQVKAFRCQPSIDTLARDRTGMLAEFEPPDFGALIRKAMM